MFALFRFVSRHRFLRLGVLFSLLMLGAAPLCAHERIGSYSHAVVIADGDQVNYYLNLPPATRALLQQNLGDDPADLTEFFRNEIRLVTWDQECPLVQMTRAPTLQSGNTIIELNYRCPRPVTDLKIISTAFLDFDESHTQFVRLAPPSDPRQALHQAVLNETHREFHVPDVKTAGPATVERGLAFGKLGIEHLLTGYDHILFLLTVIVGLSFIESIKAVTSFTIAHSITMALAFLGAVSLSPAVVEPLIAATIVYVAVENIVRTEVRRRWLWTFAFGLVHGLGFVDALKLITVSRSELVLSLFSFNIGIELAQLAVVGLALLLLRVLRKLPSFPRWQRVFSALVGLLGLVWLVQRVVAG
jgi:hypothetical protein